MNRNYETISHQSAVTKQKVSDDACKIRNDLRVLHYLSLFLSNIRVTVLFLFQIETY